MITFHHVSQSRGDLSGTRVQSSKPVNVYSGNVRALITEVEDPNVTDIDSGSRDHIVEQLIPVENWGREFNVVPVPFRIFGKRGCLNNRE